MAISWAMVVDFTPRFAITTGAWNYSYRALKKTRECVIAIPTVDMPDAVVRLHVESHLGAGPKGSLEAQRHENRR